MSRRRHSKPERGLSAGRLILGTTVLALVFSAGLIAGQRIMLEDSLPPLVSVGQPALASQRLAPTQVAAKGDDADAETSTPRDAIFSFYESLTRPEARPLITRKNAGQPETAAPVAAPKPVAEKVAEPEPEAPTPPTPAEEPQRAAAAPAPVEQAAAEPADVAATEEVEAARYTLQVASHPTMERARAEMDKLSAQGLAPHVIAADIPGQGKFYRVRIGKFATVEQARAHQSQLERTREVRTFVTPL
ncbi:SPOR domain-containing protein [Lujinxingia vulgaris]|uniref:SPOR domain-containing protein n=1 Tax=Lujinxingia vulgaris TaxID=2600176 RepID=A0A5C6XCH0_9DELT|nr:SPOR domain-containing protein [Lujinxingia vulgaris]TXD39681.1 SPOR domain-containing protein [Lujinxingia vulgaris]